MRIYIKRLSLVLLLFPTLLCSQRSLVLKDLQTHTSYFSINDKGEIMGKALGILDKEIAQHQFIGLAELHQSQQLGYFTSALLDLMAKHGFQKFAMELGPFSAQLLQKVSENPTATVGQINRLNRTYGKKLYRMTPLVFADRIEDALFIEKASALGFDFWGLDQEFLYSFEMHIDTLYALAGYRDAELDFVYRASKSLLRKWGRKDARSRNFAFACSLKVEPILQQFFEKANQNPLTDMRIKALRTSWDIYCKNESGKNSNQQRADYMKANFDSLYQEALEEQTLPKVFIKMGSVHLTRGKSPFKVDDLGKHLREKAKENHTGYFVIRHLSRYRKGKDLIGKKGWENVGLFMGLGKKEEWALCDMRPLRKKLSRGEIRAAPSLAFEINSYDFLVIPPNDRKSIPNF